MGLGVRRTRTGLLAALALQLAHGAIAQEAPANRITVLGEHSALDNGYADWNEASLQYARQLGPRHSVEAGLARTRRFGLDDTQLSAAYNLPLSEPLTLGLAATYSDTHRVLPRHSLGATLSWEFRPTWLLHGGLKQTRYDGSRVDQGSLMLERYFGNYSASLAWKPVRTQGTRADGFELRGNHFYAEGSSVGLIAAVGKEATQVGPDTLVMADVRSLALVGRHRLGTGPWSLVYAVSRTRQGDFYHRTGASLGVQYAF
jgi:YaiO family outer membrane protein